MEVYNRSVSLSAIAIATLKKLSYNYPFHPTQHLTTISSPSFFLYLHLEVNCIGNIITGNQQLLISALKMQDLLQRN